MAADKRSTLKTQYGAQHTTDHVLLKVLRCLEPWGPTTRGNQLL